MIIFCIVISIWNTTSTLPRPVVKSTFEQSIVNMYAVALLVITALIISGIVHHELLACITDNLINENNGHPSMIQNLIVKLHTLLTKGRFSNDHEKIHGEVLKIVKSIVKFSNNQEAMYKRDM